MGHPYVTDLQAPSRIYRILHRSRYTASKTQKSAEYVFVYVCLYDSVCCMCVRECMCLGLDGCMGMLLCSLDIYLRWYNQQRFSFFIIHGELRDIWLKLG